MTSAIGPGSYHYDLRCGVHTPMLRSTLRCLHTNAISYAAVLHAKSMKRAAASTPKLRYTLRCYTTATNAKMTMISIEADDVLRCLILAPKYCGRR